MISTAWAADAHGGGGMFSDPAFWVGVAFVLFLALAGKTIVKGLTKVLDDRTALIARTLGEAEIDLARDTEAERGIAPVVARDPGQQLARARAHETQQGPPRGRVGHGTSVVGADGPL